MKNYANVIEGLGTDSPSESSLLEVIKGPVREVVEPLSITLFDIEGRDNPFSARWDTSLAISPRFEIQFDKPESDQPVNGKIFFEFRSKEGLSFDGDCSDDYRLRTSLGFCSCLGQNNLFANNNLPEPKHSNIRVGSLRKSLDEAYQFNTAIVAGLMECQKTLLDSKPTSNRIGNKLQRLKGRNDRLETPGISTKSAIKGFKAGLIMGYLPSQQLTKDPKSYPQYSFRRQIAEIDNTSALLSYELQTPFSRVVHLWKIQG